MQNLTAGTRAINVGSTFTHELETDIVTLELPNFTINNNTEAPATTYSLQAAVSGFPALQHVIFFKREITY
jgi:hypothetical protein